MKRHHLEKTLYFTAQSSRERKIHEIVILAGGMGIRLAKATHMRPKPMVEIGGRPMLWHIMKIYCQYDFNDFIVCLDWHTLFDIERSIGLTLVWYQAFQGGANMRKVTLGRIDEAVTAACNRDRVQTGSVQARLSAQLRL